MNYAIYIVAILALGLVYQRSRRRHISRRLQYHERFRSIQVLEPGTGPVKGNFGLHLWK